MLDATEDNTINPAPPEPTLVCQKGPEFNQRVLYLTNSSQKNKLTFMEAVLQTAEEFEIDPDVAGELVNEYVKAQILKEATDRNMLPRTSRLPGI